MHAFLEDLLPFVVVFYLAESLVLVVAGERLFVSPWGRFACVSEGLHLAALTPWAICYSSFQPEMEWEERGVRVGSDDLLIPFADLGALRVERHLLWLTDSVSLSTPGPLSALSLRDRLRALRDAPEVARGELFARQCDMAYDFVALSARLQTLERWRGRLRPLQTALFVAVFVLVPLEVYGRSQSVTLLRPAFIVGSVLALVGVAIVLGYRLLRACGSGAGASVQSLLGFALFPPSCLHLFALIGRPLLATFAPLALAAALLPLSEFRRLARQRLRQLALVREETAWARHEAEAVRRLVAGRGLSVEDVLRAPPATDPSADSYCPTCSDEYRAGFDFCVECRVPLEPLGAA